MFEASGFVGGRWQSARLCGGPKGGGQRGCLVEGREDRFARHFSSRSEDLQYYSRSHASKSREGLQLVGLSDYFYRIQ